MQTGHLYRERLPRAILDVTQEHGFDRTQLRGRFQLWVRGSSLFTPYSTWEMALSLGADLVDLLPPRGHPGWWMKRGVTVELEEAAWQAFRQKYWEVCASATRRRRWSMSSTERVLARVEVKFGVCMAAA
eukprot:2115027-Amphidinium_carterae.1